jgi:hypothetical protein
MKIPNILKENYKGLIINVSSYIVLLVVLLYLKPTKYMLVNILFVFSVLVYSIPLIWKREFKFNEAIKFYIKIYISLLVIIYTISWLGAKGLVGFFIVIILISAYRIIKGNKLYMQGMREIETMIFGKSLDKENWDKGELKNGNKH